MATNHRRPLGTNQKPDRPQTKLASKTRKMAQKDRTVAIQWTINKYIYRRVLLSSFFAPLLEENKIKRIGRQVTSTLIKRHEV